jgi:hypothetical protein
VEKDAERSRDIKERAAEKHIPEFSFRPDIGPAKYRTVETDREQFVQRLYDYRLKQEERTKQLRHQLHMHDEGARRKINMNSKDVDVLLER